MSFEIGRTFIQYGTSEPIDAAVWLNIESIVTSRAFIACITRYGKSHLARKIVEAVFGHAGIVLLDPEGEYSSLREKFGFLIIGKDIPLQLETAEFMAEEMLKSKVSVIIDLSMVEDDELGKEYVNRFLRRFFFLETTLRQPYLVVVEEAEDFAPEKGIATETCLHALINIVKKGGKRGIGAIFLAHRPAWVSKGILSQCSNKAIGKVESTDYAALKNYARIPENILEEQLPKLEPGQFCFTGDWMKEPMFIKVGPVQTTHLGFTPKVIPPSPGELQNVITNLQKQLPGVIEKIKPTVLPIESIRAEFEEKYKTRIEAIQRTANEKAEKKYKNEMDRIKKVNEDLSRSQSLQPEAPIDDVLKHPIVMNQMSKLPDKTRDLLIKIEREPKKTRQELAAFLTTSTDSVANMISTINRTFRVEVIVGEGKPIRYKSMLQRLFITDVAKREIDELARLQTVNTDLTRKLGDSEEHVRQQNAEILRLKGLTTETESLRNNLVKANNKIETLNGDIQRLNEHIKTLVLAGKAGEALAAIIDTIIEKRFPKTANGITAEQVEEIVQKRIKEIPTPTPSPSDTFATPGPAGQAVATLQRVIHVVDLKDMEIHVGDFKTDTVKGKLLALARDGFFNAKRSSADVTNKFSTCTPQAVIGALGELVEAQILDMQHTDRNWWKLSPDVVFNSEKEVKTLPVF